MESGPPDTATRTPEAPDAGASNCVEGWPVSTKPA